MDNVNKRNLMAEMGDPFRGWADVYFSADNDHLDIAISRSDAYDDYKKMSGGKFKNSNNFKKSIKAFCKLHNYVFNPIEAGVKDGRIIQNMDGKTQECFFLKTSAEIKPDVLEEAEIY
jgi:hypothetical protein